MRARDQAAQLARQFDRDAELTARLSAAQQQPLAPTTGCGGAFIPTAITDVYGEHPAAVQIAFAENRSEVSGPDPIAVRSDVTGRT